MVRRAVGQQRRIPVFTVFSGAWLSSAGSPSLGITTLSTSSASDPELVLAALRRIARAALPTANDPDQCTRIYNANASSAPDRYPCCVPQHLVQLNGTPTTVNWTDCIGKLEGGRCQPSCAEGYHPNRDLTLQCVPVVKGGRILTTVFSTEGFRCEKTSCSGGPDLPGNNTYNRDDNDAVWTPCSKLYTGDICNVSNSFCGEGSHLSGGLNNTNFTLVCSRSAEDSDVAGSSGGTYKPPHRLCIPIQCRIKQHVRANRCVDCPDFMVGDGHEQEVRDDQETRCREQAILRPEGWPDPPWAMTALAEAMKCDIYNLPDYGSLPFAMHPFRMALGTSTVRALSGCVLMGGVLVSLLWLAGSLLPRFTAPSRLYCVQSLRYFFAFAFLPGMSFSVVRIWWSYFIGTSEERHHWNEADRNQEIVNSADLALSFIAFIVCIAPIPLLWTQVLRQAAFYGRYLPVGDQGRQTAFVFGSRVWDSADVAGSFRTRWGWVFRWYSGRARWFLLCEVAFHWVVTIVIAAVPSSKEHCVIRNWTLAVVTAVWLMLLVRIRPMRSAVGNILLIIVAGMQLVCVSSIAYGFQRILGDASDGSLHPSAWYNFADRALAGTCGIRWTKFAHDLATYAWETKRLKRLRDRKEAEHYDLKPADVLTLSKDGAPPVRSILTALRRLHGAMADLNPKQWRAPSSREERSASGPVGLIEESVPLLAPGGNFSLQQLNRSLRDWSAMSRGGASKPDGRRTSLHALGIPAAGTRLKGPHTRMVRWVDNMAMDWPAAGDEPSRRFQSCDIKCSGEHHVPRQRAGAKVKVCCLSYNMRAIIRRLLGRIIQSPNLPFVDALNTFERPWPQMTDGLLAVLVYSYEALKPASNGEPRPVQVYIEMNTAMREYGNPIRETALDDQTRRRYETVLTFFSPLIELLDQFLRQMNLGQQSAGLVFRGINVRVAHNYSTGTHFVWPSVSSTSKESSIARYFMEGSGTLFITAQRRAVDISEFALFPVEQELLLPSNSVMTVMSKLPENLLTLLGTNSDVLVVMEQWRWSGPPCQGHATSSGHELTDSQAVNLALLAIMESAFIYNDFYARYVEPQLGEMRAKPEGMRLGCSGNGRAVAAADAVPLADVHHLFPLFDSFLRSTDHKVLLITGSGGTGKTSTSLALIARTIQRAAASRQDDITSEKIQSLAVSQMGSSPMLEEPHATGWDHERRGNTLTLDEVLPLLPLFVHLPWVTDLLEPNPHAPDRRGPLTRHIQQQMFLDQAAGPGAEGKASQLDELRNRPLVIFLDSLDEVKGDISEVLRPAGKRACTLLGQAGIRLSDWPHTKWVITSRLDYVVSNSLSKAIVPESSTVRWMHMLGLNAAAVRQFTRQIVNLEMTKVCQGLHQSDHGAVAKALKAMKTVRLTDREALELQGQLKGRVTLKVTQASMQLTRFAHGQRAGFTVESGALLYHKDFPTEVTMEDLRGMPLKEVRAKFPAFRKEWCKADGSPREDWFPDLPTGAQQHEIEERMRMEDAVEALRKKGCFGRPGLAELVLIDGQPVPSVMARLQEVIAGLPPTGTVDAVFEQPFAGNGQATTYVLADELGTRCVNRILRTTNHVLRKLCRTSDDILCNPFVLHMAVTSTAKLARRPPALVDAEPRTQVYEVWLRQNIAERMPRAPELMAKIEESSFREELVMEASMWLACRMYINREWHTTVGKALKCLDHPDESYAFRKSILRCMPLRIENIEIDSSPLTWRHRSLQEYLMARSLILNPSSQVLSTGPFRDDATEALRFFDERLCSLRQVHPARAAEIASVLYAQLGKWEKKTTVYDALLKKPGQTMRTINAKALLGRSLVAVRHSVEGGHRQPLQIFKDTVRAICRQSWIFKYTRADVPRPDGQIAHVPTADLRSATIGVKKRDEQKSWQSLLLDVVQLPIAVTRQLLDEKLDHAEAATLAERLHDLKPLKGPALLWTSDRADDNADEGDKGDDTKVSARGSLGSGDAFYSQVCCIDLEAMRPGQSVAVRVRVAEGEQRDTGVPIVIEVQDTKRDTVLATGRQRTGHGLSVVLFRHGGGCTVRVMPSAPDVQSPRVRVVRDRAGGEVEHDWDDLETPHRNLEAAFGVSMDPSGTVTKVTTDGRAHKWGVKPGWLLKRINDMPLQDWLAACEDDNGLTQTRLRPQFLNSAALHIGFPEALGPFFWRRLQILPEVRGKEWRLPIAGALRPLASAGGSGAGVGGFMSPFTVLSIDTAAHDIETQAEQWAFAYPCETVQPRLLQQLDPEAAEVAFVANGGWVFTNRSGAVVAAHSISGKGDDIAFEPPQRFSAPGLRKQLLADQRLRVVTDERLRHEGAAYFAWVSGREATDEGLAAGCGALVFLFNQSDPSAPHEQDCYFAIKNRFIAHRQHPPPSVAVFYDQASSCFIVTVHAGQLAPAGRNSPRQRATSQRRRGGQSLRRSYASFVALWQQLQQERVPIGPHSLPADAAPVPASATGSRSTFSDKAARTPKEVEQELGSWLQAVVAAAWPRRWIPALADFLQQEAPPGAELPAREALRTMNRAALIGLMRQFCTVPERDLMAMETGELIAALDACRAPHFVPAVAGAVAAALGTAALGAPSDGPGIDHVHSEETDDLYATQSTADREGSLLWVKAHLSQVRTARAVISLAAAVAADEAATHLCGIVLHRTDAGPRRIGRGRHRRPTLKLRVPADVAAPGSPASVAAGSPGSPSQRAQHVSFDCVADLLVAPLLSGTDAADEMLTPVETTYRPPDWLSQKGSFHSAALCKSMGLPSRAATLGSEEADTPQAAGSPQLDFSESRSPTAASSPASYNPLSSAHAGSVRCRQSNATPAVLQHTGAAADTGGSALGTWLAARRPASAATLAAPQAPTAACPEDLTQPLLGPKNRLFDANAGALAEGSLQKWLQQWEKKQPALPPSAPAPDGAVPPLGCPARGALGQWLQQRGEGKRQSAGGPLQDWLALRPQRNSSLRPPPPQL